MAVTLDRRQRVTFIDPLVAMAVYLLVLAGGDFLAGSGDAGTSLMVLGGLVALTVAARVAACRLTVGPDVVICEGVVRGWVVDRAAIRGVVRARRFVGWPGLSIVTESGSTWKLPLTLCSLDEPALEALRLRVAQHLGLAA